ncbi:hypothetical protein [Streptomyces sp. NPDC021020]|uniref:hypothetical protein n=1 Tax=Streptomyces sp. NPDC021020 TaxID=3365109 RepID=UPI0037A9B487
MTGGPERPSRLAWLQENRVGIAILLGVIWMGAMFLIMHDAAIAVICGAAFAGVLAATLPRPPKP